MQGKRNAGDIIKEKQGEERLLAFFKDGDEEGREALEGYGTRMLVQIFAVLCAAWGKSCLNLA